MKVKQICKNPLCVQSYNLIMGINEYFAENTKAKITSEEFMEMQYLQWQTVKKMLGIKLPKREQTSRK